MAGTGWGTLGGTTAAACLDTTSDDWDTSLSWRVLIFFTKHGLGGTGAAEGAGAPTRAEAGLEGAQAVAEAPVGPSSCWWAWYENSPSASHTPAGSPRLPAAWAGVDLTDQGQPDVPELSVLA